MSEEQEQTKTTPTNETGEAKNQETKPEQSKKDVIAMFGNLTIEQMERLLDQIAPAAEDQENHKYYLQCKEILETIKTKKVRDETITLALVLYRDENKRDLMYKEVGITTNLASDDALGFVLSMKFLSFTKERLTEIKNALLALI